MAAPMCPIVLGKHNNWMCSARGDLAQEVEGWHKLDKKNPLRHTCGSSEFLWHPRSADALIGVIQFKSPASQPKAVKVVRDVFPRATLMVEALKDIQHLDRQVQHIKDLKHWNEINNGN